MPSLKPHGQMSEAFITALFLSVSGGLQDVYTYLYSIIDNKLLKID